MEQRTAPKTPLKTYHSYDYLYSSISLEIEWFENASQCGRLVVNYPEKYIIQCKHTYTRLHGVTMELRYYICFNH